MLRRFVPMASRTRTRPSKPPLTPARGPRFRARVLAELTVRSRDAGRQLWLTGNGSSARSPNCWTDPVRDVRFRPAAAEDFTFLASMLGEAAVWRPDKPTPTADQVLADPRYAMYLAGW